MARGRERVPFAALAGVRAGCVGGEFGGCCGEDGGVHG